MTFRKRLFEVAPKFGLHLSGLWPGVAVLSRRAGLRVKKLGPGARLVVRQGLMRKDVHEFQKRVYQYLVTEHVAWILRLFEVNCVLDVGANVGQYAKELRRSGYRGRIVSFEPLPHIAEELERAAADDPNWWVYPYALGREDTTVEMTVVKGTMSSILPPSDFGSDRYKRFDNSRLEKIEVRRLDGLLDEVFEGIEHPRPYLKLDTQGYDLEAFAGAGDRVGEFVGMQSEVALLRIYEGSPRMAESLATYEDAGFEITGMFPVSRHKTTGRVVEFDCVLTRADAAPER